MSAKPARPEQDQAFMRDPRERKTVPAARPQATLAGQMPSARASMPGRPPARRGSDNRVLRDLIEPNWVLMAPVFVAAAATNGIANLSLPSWLTVVISLVAVALAASTPWMATYERKQLATAKARNLASALFIAVPMFLFGLALSSWTHRIDGPWESPVGMGVIVATLATIILNRRVAGIITAQAAIWAGLAVYSGSQGSWLALALGSAVGLYAAIRQTRSDMEQTRVERDRHRAQLRAEEILNDFEQTGQGWFWETDRRGALVYVSPTIGLALGVDHESLLGRPFGQLFEQDTQGHEGERTLAFHLSSRSAFVELALRAATQGDERWWSVSGRPIYDSFGNHLGFRGSGHDLTEKRRSEEQVSRMAHYDSLTGLSNRVQMAQTLEKILNAPNLEHRACSVFLLDLDRFKQVNDTMGHPAGDSLLIQVARRLQRTIGEHGRVGRLGGDEFQIILPGRHRSEELAELAKRVIRDLSEPYSIEGHRVVIGASIGVAVSPEDGVTSESLIRNADLALYAAKDGGRGRHHFYASDLHSDAEERRQLEQDLRDALAQGGLELYYQPVIHTVTERITGFEALMRWNHPTKGWLSPAKFIPIAEDSGLIAPIGEWALRTACHDLAKWPESVRVAVNVSPLQFANPSLPSIITNALAAAQVNPARLELEITESVFLSDDDGIDAMFAALKRVGVRLALDDFGTGYSALGYLKKAPFDKIKIDQSFVRGATITGSRNGAIIASIVSLAEALGMETTAEGVETLDELDLVRMLGCSHVQGFIYAKPMDREAATHRLQTGLTVIAKGPRAARSVRHTMLRKVMLDHGGQQYQCTIRNISATGAMVEGLWNVPPGTIFSILMAEGQIVTATARWSQQDRMGVEFSSALEIDDSGRIALISGTSGERIRSSFLRHDPGVAA